MSKKGDKTPENVTATGLTRDTKAKCWNVYIAKNNGPRDGDAEFAERLQTWLNLQEGEELVLDEKNECWKALLNFWNRRIDFYRTKAPSWTKIDTHKEEIRQHFQRTGDFKVETFDYDWDDVAELLPKISDDAWSEYYSFWKRPAMQVYSSTTLPECPVRDYCRCIFSLEMLGIPKAIWKAMLDFRDVKAKIPVKITLVQKLELQDPQLSKGDIAKVLKDIEKNKKIKTQGAQKELETSRASKFYLHCEMQMLLLFYQLRNNANPKIHRFIGCSKLSCHMCWQVLKYCKYKTRGTHAKISANWSFQIPSSLEGNVKTFTNLHSKWQYLFHQYPNCKFPSWPQQKDTNPAHTVSFEIEMASFKFSFSTIQRLALLAEKKEEGGGGKYYIVPVRLGLSPLECAF